MEFTTIIEHSNIIKMITSVSFIAIAYYISNTALKVAVKKMVVNDNHQVTNIVLKFGNMGLMLVFGVVLMSTLGVEVGALIAGLGLGGFALGLALKDSVSNLLSGVLIMIYQPFKIGDNIKVSGVDGVVNSIDLRYTFIQGEDHIFLIPNKKVFSETITIYNSKQYD
jgi:small-conductance mechanosensitive channel